MLFFLGLLIFALGMFDKHHTGRLHKSTTALYGAILEFLSALGSVVLLVWVYGMDWWKARHATRSVESDHAATLKPVLNDVLKRRKSM